MKSKGFVFIVEMISAVIILFITFNFFFPPISFKQEWDEALLSLLSRDIILSLERNGELYKYSFDFQSLKDFLYDKKLIPRSLVVWPETKNAIKTKIKVACNCPPSVIDDLENLLAGLKINDREIDFEIVDSGLSIIKPSDVLLIWGYKDLSNFVQPLEDYLAEGNGIVEVSDITSTQIDADKGHKEIFGLTSSTASINNVISLEFSREPENSRDIVFGPWKYFYHVPIPLGASPAGNQIPLDTGFKVCNSVSKGNFSIQINPATLEPYYYDFWICDSQSVYFDTDSTGKGDLELKEGDNFNLGTWSFTLSSIEQNRIYVRFNQNYKFSDFLAVSWQPKTYNKIIAIDDQKVLLKASNEVIPAVVLNEKYGKIAWVVNFTEMKISDDERLLLTSLLLWASKKYEKSTAQASKEFSNHFINVYDKDFFEVYSFNLGLGYL
ncbi:MAG: hypothetical protein ACP5O8_00770 [Candidatus Aenigmatarchaeota archaeon]